MYVSLYFCAFSFMNQPSLKSLYLDVIFSSLTVYMKIYFYLRLY